jgi:hypothetical protein
MSSFRNVTTLAAVTLAMAIGAGKPAQAATLNALTTNGLAFNALAAAQIANGSPLDDLNGVAIEAVSPPEDALAAR